VLATGLTVVAREMRHDPMGHGGWPLWWLGSVFVAAFACYGLSEAHRNRQRAGNTSAPSERAV
jgi:hypothetical protein